MNKADKEALANKLRVAIEKTEQSLIPKRDDASPDAARLRGKIDGLMEALNLVRGS